jgi:hypothetical protein
MLMGGIFLPVKNLIMAHLDRTFLTGTELELWLAVGSRLCMLEGRYHMTAWNQFYYFHYSSKKYDRRQTFSAHTFMILTVFFYRVKHLKVLNVLLL